MKLEHFEFGPLMISIPIGWQSEICNGDFTAWHDKYNAAVAVSCYARVSPSQPTDIEAREQCVRFAKQQGWSPSLEIETLENSVGSASAVFSITVDDTNSVGGTFWRVRILLTPTRLVVASYNVSVSDRQACETTLDAVVRSVSEARPEMR